MKTTRREALVAIAASAAAPAGLSANEAYQPQTLSAETYRRLGVLVDTIIPETDTPGAHQAGVTRTVDEDSARSAALKRNVEKLVSSYAAEGFFDGSEPERERLMTEYMNAGGEKGELFAFLKNLVIDRYYSSEAGLVEELGYQGNTYLPAFPGCQHDHELEEGV